MTVRKRQVMSPLHCWLSGAVRESGVRQVEIAEKTGMSRQHISQMMTGAAEGSLTAWSAVLVAAGVLGVEPTAARTQPAPYLAGREDEGAGA